MKRMLLSVRLLPAVLKLRYWATKCKDPQKKKLCTLLYSVSAIAYNDLKPKWMPMLKITLAP